MSLTLYALASVIIVSLTSLIGVLTLRIKTSTLKKFSDIIVSFAVGAMFGDVFIHLLPETYAYFEKTDNLILLFLPFVGIFMFFFIEKVLRWRHSHIPVTETTTKPIATLSIAGDSLHNFIDGVIIGASYLISLPMGLASTFAIILHEIPQEMGDFGILLHAGIKADRALFFNFLSSLVAVIGTIIALAVGSNFSGFTNYLLPVAAGGFIYIAGTDLVPELHQKTRIKHSLLQFAAIVAGIGAMAALLILGI